MGIPIRHVLVACVAVVFRVTCLAQPCPDADSDGFADCTVLGCDSSGLVCGDCDDSSVDVNPDAGESCNHVDDDCNGTVDDGFPVIEGHWFISDPANSQDEGLAEERALANVGDLDGDGFDEIAAGLPFDFGQTSRVGSVAVFSGADSSIFCRLFEPIASQRFGHSLAGVGDVDGDSTPDFVVGQDFDGRAYVFSGSDCSLIRELEYTLPDGADQRFGWSLSGIGDIDGDSVPDILVGAPGWNGDTGQVIAYSGATGTMLARYKDPDGAPGDNLGQSVVSISDINGDGTFDLVSGAHLDDREELADGIDAGSVLAFSGSSGTVLFKSTGMSDSDGWNGDRFGFAVGVIDDVDGDGTTDVIASAPRDNIPGGYQLGSVTILSGASGAAIREMYDPEGKSSSRLGWAVTSFDDLDGDGLSDIAATDFIDETIDSVASSLLVFSSVTGETLWRIQENIKGSSLIRGDFGDTVRDNLVGSAYRERLVAFSFDTDCDGDGVNPAGGDCDDQNEARFAGNQEICDGIDNDCDGEIDLDDDDRDGFGVCDDCDISNPAIYPGARERCNGLDDDCDGSVDEGTDYDGDGNQSPCDCDDANPAVGPQAVETCNHIDDDCNGAVDDGYDSSAETEYGYASNALPGDSFGRVIAAVSDVTGDGITDFLVGAPDRDGSSTDEGMVYLFSGSDRSEICSITAPDPGAGDKFGSRLTGIGDIDGDGVPDFAVGVPLDDLVDAVDAGSVMLFSGADCSHIRTLLDASPSTGDQFGYDVSSVGDIGGDGVDDIVVGVRFDDAVAEDAGSAQVFSGADGALQLLLENPAGNPFDQLGTSTAGPGDLNGDTVPDIVVGAPYDDKAPTYDGPDGINDGLIIAFSGSDGSVLWNAQGSWNNGIGVKLLVLPDVDDDGVQDLGVQAFDPSFWGLLHVYSGADGTRISNGDSGSGSLAWMADMTGDAIPEVAVGDPSFWQPPSYPDRDQGAIGIYSAADGSFIRRLIDPAGAGGDRLGEGLAAIGDVTGGGSTEIVAGAPGADGPSGVDAGKFVVFSIEGDCDGDGFSLFSGDCNDTDANALPGGTEVCDHSDNDCSGVVDDGFDTGIGTEEILDPRSPLQEQREWFGKSLAALGDVTGDGISDFVVGAPYERTENGGFRAGTALVYSGATRLLICRAENPDGQPYERLGYSVALIGDVTGDGIPEFAAGAHEGITDRGKTGSVSLFSARDCSFVRKLTDPDGVENGRLGQSVAGISDMDGDHIPDVIAGSPRTSSPDSDGGKVILFSGADGSIIRVLTDPSGHNAARLGFSVAAAGDVDGDGTEDIASGAPRDDDGQNLGAIVLFSGSDGSVLRKLRDGAETLGSAVISGIDLDGDSTPDTVGNAGSGNLVTVFSGADGAVIRRLQEDTVISSWPDRLAWMPDISGDGIEEILVGRPRWNSGAGAVGRVLMYSGADGLILDELRDPLGVPGDEFGSAVLSLDVLGDGGPDTIIGAAFALGYEGKLVLFATQSDCDGDGAIPFGGVDCDDQSQDTYSGAPETNDGVDNQCGGDSGFGLIDEISGLAGFFNSQDKTLFSWDEQIGATMYEVVRSSSPAFDQPCAVQQTVDTFWSDSVIPSPGMRFNYLVRALAPNTGSWGADSGGTERSNVCP